MVKEEIKKAIKALTNKKSSKKEDKGKVIKEALKEIVKEDREEREKEAGNQGIENSLLQKNENITKLASKIRQPAPLGAVRANNLESAVNIAPNRREEDEEENNRTVTYGTRQQNYQQRGAAREHAPDIASRALEYVPQEGRQTITRPINLIEQAQRARQARPMPAQEIPDAYKAAYEHSEKGREGTRPAYKTTREVIKRDIKDIIEGKKEDYVPRSEAED